MNQQFHKKENVVDVYRQTSWSGQIMGHIKKKFTGHMFNINIKKKSYKMCFKSLPFKIECSKNQQSSQGWMGWEGAM